MQPFWKFSQHVHRCPGAAFAVNAGQKCCWVLGVCFVFFFILLKFTSNVSLADLGPVGASRECHRLPSGALDPVPDLLPGGLHASLLLPTPDLNDSCF